MCIYMYIYKLDRCMYVYINIYIQICRHMIYIYIYDI